MEEVVPADVTLFVWGDPVFLSWGEPLHWLPDARRLISVVRRELNHLGVPFDSVQQIGMGMRIVGQRHDWFVFLDGEWDAQKVFDKKREVEGADAEVDVDGTKTVRIRDRVLFLVGGAERIIVGNDEVIRSIVSLMNGDSTGAADKLRELGEGLPSAPLNVALLQRYTFVPGVEEGVFRLGLNPNPSVEGRIVCISDYEGCDRLQEKIHSYVEDLKIGALPEGIPEFLDRIRVTAEPGKESMWVTSAP
jgi:hypothetical protein